jgi:excisionase family DNA binding protein
MKYTAHVTDWNDVPVLLDLPYAARIVGMSAEYIKRLSNAGKFPAVKVGNSWRVNRDDLMVYVGAKKAEQEEE